MSLIDRILANKYTDKKVNDPLAQYKKAYEKLQNGENETYNISVVGDSISAGSVAGVNDDDYLNFSYLGLLRNEFAQVFEDTGNGLIPSHYEVPQPKWTFTAGWSEYTLMGIAQSCMQTSTAGETATISFNGTGIGILTRGKPGRGTFGVSVDGGAQTVISLDYPADEVKIEEVTGFTDGAHTAVIENLEANELVVMGAYEIKGNSGFRVNFCGRSGRYTKQFAYNDYVLSAEIDAFSPVLTVIASITNDIGATLDINTYRNNLQTLIDRGKQYGDVLLLANNGRTDKTHATQLLYVNAMKDLSESNNCLFVNSYERWDREADNMGYMDDLLHPNATGHADLANTLKPILIK